MHSIIVCAQALIRLMMSIKDQANSQPSSQEIQLGGSLVLVALTKHTNPSLLGRLYGKLSPVLATHVY